MTNGAENPVAPVVSVARLSALAWPLVVMRATQSVIGFCDALMVAPLGQEPLAAVTTGALNTFAFVMLPMGTVLIVQSFAAQLSGRGELGAVRRFAGYGLCLALAAGLLALLCIPFLSWFLGKFAYAPAVHRDMSSYMSIRLLSVGAIVGTEALGNWYAGLGNTRLAMRVGVIAMLANVLGNYLLIQPRFGLPGYGAAGAAWASTAASWLGFGIIALAFARGLGHDLPRTPLAFKLRELLRVLRFGLPNGINWFLEFAAFTLFINVVVAHLGTTVLAAFNVVLQINSVSFMPAFGISSAGAILVAEAIGRRKLEYVWPIVRMTGAVACTWMVSIGLIYLLAPATLIELFRSPNAPARTLLETGTLMLCMSAIWQLFDALSLTLSEALRAAGDTAWCMGARIILAWIIFTPVAWTSVLVFRGGVVTVMLSLVGYLAALAAAFAVRFASGRWRQIELVDSEPKLI